MRFRSASNFSFGLVIGLSFLAERMRHAILKVPGDKTLGLVVNLPEQAVYQI